MQISEKKQNAICKLQTAVPYCLFMAFCCFSCLLGQNIAAEPISINTEIAHLRQLSESHPDQALVRLKELSEQSSEKISATDLRNLLLLRIPLNIENGDKKQAKELIFRLVQIGNQFHDQIATVMASNFQAKMLGDEGKFGEGLADIEPALQMIKQINDALVRNQIENMAGELYSSLGNFQVALAHHLSALESLDSVEEQSWQFSLARAKTLNSVGRMYLSLKDDDTALSYLAKAKELAKNLDAPALLSSIANNRGYAFADQENWKSAIGAYEESLMIARKVGNHNSEAKSLNNLADASLNQKKYSACVEYAQQSIVVAHRDAISNVEAIAQTNLGICHIYMGELTKGIAEDKSGIDFARNSKAKPTLEGMLSDLANAYKSVGMYKDALQTLEERDQITNELFHAERDRAMIEMKVHFDLSQHQKEIEKLEQQNILQKVEIKNKNLQKIVSIFIIISAVAAALGVFVLYKKVRKSNLRLRAANLKLKDQSTRDPLTGLLNRRAFQAMIDSFGLESERQNSTATGLHDVLVLLDIDHFKHVNDNYGHPTGDKVLVEIGKRLQQILRGKDMLMRWGGEEFLIYLHRVPADKVSQIIQRELAAVGSAPIRKDDASDEFLSVTVSAGYILMPLPGVGDLELSWEKALKLIDLALYIAKTSGRNQGIGLESVDGTKEQIEKFIDGDIQGAIDSEIVELQRIKGV